MKTVKGHKELKKLVSIPSREAWVYRNPQAIGKIRKGLKEAAQGKTDRVGDLDSFLGREKLL